MNGNYGDDENYRFDYNPVEAVAVSAGQNDSGRFQLDLRDEKLLPFEGAAGNLPVATESPRSSARSTTIRSPT